MNFNLYFNFVIGHLISFSSAVQSTRMTKKKRFLVIDGNALLHRAWHAIPPLVSSDGTVVNAVYGFANVIEKARVDFEPDFMAVAWDLPGGTFRHEAYAEYKGTRKKKEQELYDQIPMIQDLLKIYGIPSLSMKGMEADDVIGTLAKKYGPKKSVMVSILTGDLDALQLIDDDVEVITFVKGLSVTKIYDEKAVMERYGLKPDQLIDLKALMGDSSDNIPGLVGVGKKTAGDLLIEYGSIENIFKAIEKDEVPEKFAKKFRGQEKRIEEMRFLVTIVNDLDLKFKVEDAKVIEPNREKLLKSYQDFGFRRLVAKYQDENINPKQNQKESSTSNSNKKSKLQTVKKLKDLEQKTLVLNVEVGEQSLFGGSIKEIAVYDGKKVFIKSLPQEKEVNEVIEFVNEAELVIGHDLKSAMHLLDHVSSPIFDTMVGAYLLSPGTRKFDLITAAHEHLGKTLKETADSSEKVKIILELHKELVRGIKEEKMLDLSNDIEMPLIPILHKMEDVGIEIDQKKLKDLSVKFGTQLEKLTKKIYKLAGREFNVNSPSQLADILFDDLELSTKRIKKTKTGYSTAASELEKLWETHEIVPLISEYREFAKLKSTYVDALPNLVKEDGRIHTSYNQTITATGRLSSSDPNLQNIPTRTKLGKEIRKAFVAPKGKTLVAIDYSQFELRLAASFSKDKGFIEAFKSGVDVHSRTAADVLDKKIEDVTKEERSAAKAINFGILYGMGSRKLALSTGFSLTEAKAFIEKYFAVHPGISDYIENAKAMAHERGYAETLFGRRRYLPEISSGIHMLVAAAERMAVNMPIQGTQADLVKIAMIDVADWIENVDLDVTMLLQVHDELVFEIADKDLDAAIPEIKKIMEAVWDDDVPLKVDVEVGRDWGELRMYE